MSGVYWSPVKTGDLQGSMPDQLSSQGSSPALWAVRQLPGISVEQDGSRVKVQGISPGKGRNREKSRTPQAVPCKYNIISVA